jgi:hypothetical protein
MTVGRPPEPERDRENGRAEEGKPEAAGARRFEPKEGRCELCGFGQLDRHCKVVCPNCGFVRDCSDP